MAFQSKRTFELIDPSTFDSEAALRKAAKEYYRDLTFDGDDEGLEEDIWLARRPAACDPDNHPAVLVHAFTKICVWSSRFRLRPPLAHRLADDGSAGPNRRCRFIGGLLCPK